MTPERLHDLAARTRAEIDEQARLWPYERHTAADRERLASDLATYDLAVEGLAEHYDDGCGVARDGLWITTCIYRDYESPDPRCPDARRYTALRDEAERSIERTAALYGVTS